MKKLFLGAIILLAGFSNLQIGAMASSEDLIKAVARVDLASMQRSVALELRIQELERTVAICGC
jgi:hypothetical protein